MSSASKNTLFFRNSLVIVNYILMGLLLIRLYFNQTNYIFPLTSPLHHYNCGENVSQWAASCSRIKTNIFIIELLIFILLNYILKRNYNWKAFCLQCWRTEVWHYWSSNFVHSMNYQQGKPCIGPCCLLALQFLFLSLLCHGLVSLTDKYDDWTVCLHRN